MTEAYGIPVPRGVRKDWEVHSMGLEGAGAMARNYSVPEDWGDPLKFAAWFDRFGRCRVAVGHYANGRSALVRFDANGVWKTTFGQWSEPKGDGE